MKKSKVILALVCAVLLVCASVLGTLAYLTSTDTVTNTFTVGNVKITLDEAKVDTNGVVETDATTQKPVARVKANTYKLMPGHSYTKDPTIHVDTSSEDCFIRAKVVVTNASKWQAIITKYNDVTFTSFFDGFDETLWYVSSPETDTENDTMTFTFTYKNETKAESLKRVWQSTDGKSDLVLFNKIKMPGSLTDADLTSVQNTTITVTADAIQADGFVESSNDATAAANAYAAAMNALDGQKAAS